jgi:dTMP kinase
MKLFITLEGGEGSGKSFHSRTLYRKLTALQIPSILIHEPGGTPLGDRVRRLLKQSRGIPISPLTELMLFNASRSQLVKDVILPNLKEGKIVICDRFTDSTIAYQSYGRGLDLNTVTVINHTAAQGLKPDLTFLLDVPPKIGLSRKQAGANDRFEQEAVAFHQKVREGFLQMASEDTRRWQVINATLPRNEVSRRIWDKVNQFLSP